VDTGFIVFNQPNYPLFCRLLEKLQIESRGSDMSFSVADEHTGTEYSGRSLSTLFSQRSLAVRPSHWRMLADIRRFMRTGATLLSASPQLSLEDFVRTQRYSPHFADRFLIPLAAALWSCPASAVRTFPVQFVVQFLANHSMLQISGRPQWRTIVGGSHRYLQALVQAASAEFRTGSPVERVRRTAQGVVVESGSRSASFDEVILAVHADQALAMLHQPTPQECRLLSAFPYQPNEVVLHTDTSVLPKCPRAWASWNYRIPRQDAQVCTVTYNMNMLQGLETEKTYCVTLNQSDGIAPDAVIARFQYHHPVPTAAGVEARMHRDRLIRNQGISCVGAYWGYGFHEDGVRSAVDVVRAFGAEFP
jgi:predicted NAD/FAD-binding protein